ncbi:MAG TPA: phospholipid carrier-dependent glycosyltransferase [Roseiflexaceae bacterium]|nr:phospholipid carrier-dependent glycosyltransferase [Roseiflexaceae bacterium]
MESARKLAATGESAQARTAWPTVALVLLLGGVALVPRVLGLVDFLTTDEVYNWISRVERFSGAVARGQWAATVLVGHPGVTLCWLASLGLAAERYAVEHGWASVSSQVEYLRWLRLPMAILEALAVPGAYLLLRRLVAPATALLAAALWALSPFLVAHARLLHLDALLTTFVTYSLLCTLIGCHFSANESSSDRSLGWIAAGGVCAGLALLTKGPALILLPIVGLIMVADRGSRIADWRHLKSIIANLQPAITGYLLWLAAAALTFTLLWPAMWADPAHALRAFFGLIVQNGGRENGDGQFFLGRAIGDPGPLFYIISNLFRMTPVMLIGLLGAPLALWRAPDEGPRTKDQGRRSMQIANRWSSEQRALLALAVFALFWTLVMTIGPKKFDRYTLPTWPALLVLSAAGWKFLLWDLPARLHARRPSIPISWWPRIRGGVIALLLALEVIPLARYHPYYLSYYNPVLGGGAAAQRALLIGWGEGMDQAGAYLSSRRDIGDGQILSALPRTLRPFVQVPVEDVTEFGNTTANYVVVYLESIQRGASPEIYATIRQTAPLHRITIHGIDYVEIYQLPKPFEKPIDARFGDQLVLRGVSLKRAPGQLTVTPSWDVRRQPAVDYQVFVHVLDEVGRTVAQIDVAPGGGDAPPTSAWQAGQQIAVPLPLALPSDLPAGSYQVTFGVYDAQTGQRQPFAGGTAADAARAGPNALLLDTIVVP